MLTLKDNDGRDNRITVSLKYLPIKMQLDPSESFNNQGTLRVDVLDAADLPAADRNGFSDPFCRFILHDKEVYKTKIQKKTLHPAWNEFFEVPIRSRTAAKFRVDVFDWDFGDKADFLGRAAITLDMLEPFLAQTVDLGLDGKSGTIRLKMLFRPDYVVRSRQGSSTFSGTFAAPGKVIGAPVKGVGKGAVFVGGGVVKGASFLGRGFKRRKSRGASGAEDFGDRAESPDIDEPVPAISVEPTANGAENGTAESPEPALDVDAECDAHAVATYTAEVVEHPKHFIALWAVGRWRSRTRNSGRVGLVGGGLPARHEPARACANQLVQRRQGRVQNEAHQDVHRRRCIRRRDDQAPLRSRRPIQVGRQGPFHVAQRRRARRRNIFR